MLHHHHHHHDGDDRARGSVHAETPISESWVWTFVGARNDGCGFALRQNYAAWTQLGNNIQQLNWRIQGYCCANQLIRKTCVCDSFMHVAFRDFGRDLALAFSSGVEHATLMQNIAFQVMRMTKTHVSLDIILPSISPLLPIPTKFHNFLSSESSGLIDFPSTYLPLAIL